MLNAMMRAQNSISNKLGSHAPALALVAYDQAMTWRLEMEVSEIVSPTGLEVVIGTHPVEGDLVVICGSTQSAIVLRSSVTYSDLS